MRHLCARPELRQRQVHLHFLRHVRKRAGVHRRQLRLHRAFVPERLLRVGRLLPAGQQPILRCGWGELYGLYTRSGLQRRRLRLYSANMPKWLLR